MDVGKIVEALTAAGPSAGMGLAVGLLLFVSALMTNRVVMVGRFSDMKDQRDKGERRLEKLEQEKAILERENSELRLLLVSSFNTSRKNAALATVVMHKRVEEEEEKPHATSP